MRFCLVFICVILLLSDVSAGKNKNKKKKKPVTIKASTTSPNGATGTTAPNGVLTEAVLDLEISSEGVTEDGTVTSGRDGGTRMITTSQAEIEAVTKVIEVLPTDEKIEVLTTESDVLYTEKEEGTTEFVTDSSTTGSTEDGTVNTILIDEGSEETTTATEGSEVSTEEGSTGDGTSGTDGTTNTGGTIGTTGTTGSTGPTDISTEEGTTSGTTEWFSTEFLTTPDHRFGFICPPYMFSCRRTEKCIGLGMVCDGKDDCGGNDDERDCPEDTENQSEPGVLTAVVKCDYEEISCHKSNSCIPNFLKCNGIKDCPEGEDEESCPILKCTHDHTLCNDKKMCVPNVDWCDGKEHCADGSDESNCAEELQCSIWDRQCRNGDCIEAIYWCDGYADCWDYSDETDCGVGSEFKKKR